MSYSLVTAPGLGLGQEKLQHGLEGWCVLECCDSVGPVLAQLTEANNVKLRRCSRRSSSMGKAPRLFSIFAFCLANLKKVVENALSK